MKKYIYFFLTVLLISACVKPGENYYPSAMNIVDLDNLAAIGVKEDPNAGSSRGSSDNSDLVKIMADGRVERLLKYVPSEGELSQIPEVRAFIPSPVNNDLFILFNGTLTIGNIDYGSLVYVNEDGDLQSVFPYQKVDENAVDSLSRCLYNLHINYEVGIEQFIEFDSDGNMYCIVDKQAKNGGIVQILGKFNINDNSFLDITPEVPGFSFDFFRIAPGGRKAVLMGNRDGLTSSNFCYLYDLQNPKVFKDVIYYSSGMGSNAITGIEFVSDSKIICGFNRYLDVTGIFEINIDEEWKLSFNPVFSTIKESSFLFRRNSEYNFMLNDWIFSGVADLEIAVVNTPGKIDFQKVDVKMLNNELVLTSHNATSYNFALDLENPEQTEQIESSNISDFFFSEKSIVRFTCGQTWDSTLYKTEDKKMFLTTEMKARLYDCYTSENFNFGYIVFVNPDLTFNKVKMYLKSIVEDPESVEFVFDGSSGEAAVEKLKETIFIPTHKIATSKNYVADYTAFETNFLNNSTKLNESNGDSSYFSANYKFHIFNDGSIWGSRFSEYASETLDSFTFVNLFDSAGENNIKSFSYQYFPTKDYKMNGSCFFYLQSRKTAQGMDSGSHNLLMVDFSKADPQPVSLLQNIPNNESIEIIDFSGNNEFVYITGLINMGEIITGKIDISSLQFTPITGIDSKLSKIQIYNGQ